jgi:hypothetical protein
MRKENITYDIPNNCIKTLILFEKIISIQELKLLGEG